jgi:Tfp pilus assembly protein PilP
MVTGLVGCGEDPDLIQPDSPSGRKEVAQAKDTKPVEPTPQPEVFNYDAAGRRNPFKSLVVVNIKPDVVKEIKRNEASLTPLEKYETKEFKLVGVVGGRGEDYAMVESPDGKTYNFKAGTRIGKKEGIVQKITDVGVVVKELIHYESGKTEEIETVIPFNRGQ